MTTEDDRMSLIELDLPKSKPSDPLDLPDVKHVTYCADLAKRGLLDNANVMPMARAMTADDRQRAAAAKPATARQSIPLPTPEMNAAEQRLAAERIERDRAKPQPIAGYCGCPLGTRPAAVRNGSGVNLCPTCHHPRRGRAALPTQTTTVSAESTAVAASLGVQAATARGSEIAREILTPHATALRTIREKLGQGRGLSADELKKIEVQLASVTVETGATPNGFVRHTEVIAGAKNDASGIFTGFGGQGSLTRGELLAKLREARMPEEWAMGAKSAHAQAGRVLQGLARGGHIVRAVRLNRADPQLAAARARWTVGTANGGAGVGGAFGITLLVVTLGTDDRLVIEGDAGLGVRVRTEFDAAVATEEYSATDVSGWLSGVLMNRFRAARVGGNWYIRKSYAADAERLLTVFSRGWGRDWLLPAIPMSTCEQLAAGLATNFIAEAEGVLAVYCEELAEAEKHGKREIGSKRATTLHMQIRELAQRASGYAMMLGDRHVAELRAKLSAAANEISKSIDGITQRFELIFDELRYEADRSA